MHTNDDIGEQPATREAAADEKAPRGPVQRCAVPAIALGLAGFHLYTAWVGVMSPYVQRGTHLLTLLVLAFLYVQHKSAPLRILGWALAGLSVLVATYFIRAWDPQLILDRGIMGPSQTDFLLGLGLLALVLEGTRRTIGMPIVVVALCFVAYGYFGPWMPEVISHKGYSLERMVEYLVWSTNGVFGTPLAVSATFVIVFIMFGALLETLGAGKLFIDLAIAATGRLRGGPALTSILGSSLMGSISGSSVANVVTTGTFTIPLMKRSGYRKEFAAGVEAVASTGGQIMPPIMGAGAFVMAELLGVAYSEIILAATIPAILFFLSLALMVYFEARRAGLDALPSEALPEAGKAFREKGFLLIPLVVLVVCIVWLRYSATISGLFGIISLVVVASLAELKKRRRLPLRKTLEGLKNGVLIAIPVAMACATAGIVIGIVSQTGLGVRFTQLIVSLSDGSLWLAALLTMLACIILGMGLPTTAAYIITAVLGVPALVELGVPVMAAHMFIFYFAIISFITPPVGLSAYAASGIAGSNPFYTSLLAFKLGLAGFLVPFAFLYAPGLLMIGTAGQILLASSTALVGIVALAAALIGWCGCPLPWLWRSVLFASSIALISPDMRYAAAGLVPLLATLAYAIFSTSRPAPEHS